MCLCNASFTSSPQTGSHHLSGNNRKCHLDTAIRVLGSKMVPLRSIKPAVKTLFTCNVLDNTDYNICSKKACLYFCTILILLLVHFFFLPGLSSLESEPVAIGLVHCIPIFLLMLQLLSDVKLFDLCFPNKDECYLRAIQALNGKSI